MISKLLLAADIGGTKSDVALFECDVSCSVPLLQKKYINADFSGIEDVVACFLAECDHIPTVACLAVAGIISGDRVCMTNLPWQADCSSLRQRFGFSRVLLINDLTALCSSLPLLGGSDLLEVQKATAAFGEIKGVLAPGTGLGEGLLVSLKSQQLACGCEGGHTDFAPVDDEQLALLTWMQKREKPVSYEMLIAGPGLVRLYEFCRDYHRIPESNTITYNMARADDVTPVIIDGALSEPCCPLCRHVLELFLAILGSEAGNLALKVYATGGIYLGGGILSRIAEKISYKNFLKNFCSKEQMAELLASIPVHVILKRDAALIGAARFGHNEFFKNDDNG